MFCSVRVEWEDRMLSAFSSYGFPNVSTVAAVLYSESSTLNVYILCEVFS